MDRAAVFGGDFVGDRKSKAAAARTVAHEGVEEVVAQRFGDAGAVVGDVDAGSEPPPFFAQGDLAGDAGFEGDRAAAVGGLRGVFEKIEEELDEPFAVEEWRWDADVVVAGDRKFGVFGGDEPTGLFEGLVEVGRVEVGVLVGGGEAREQGVEPVGFANDHFGVFGVGGVGELQGKELRGSFDAAQGVFDFVRDRARHLLHGVLQPLPLFGFGGEALAVDGFEFDEETARWVGAGADGEVGVPGVAVGMGEEGVGGGVEPARASRGVERLGESGCGAQHRGDGLAGELVAAAVEEVFGGGVDEGDAGVRVENEHRSGQFVQGGEHPVSGGGRVHG